MSKRHQSSRRKAYGRRQHELRERAGRGSLSEPIALTFLDDAVPSHEPISLHDGRVQRLPYAVGE